MASGEGSGDASCSLLIVSSFVSSFAGAALVALFFLAETGLSPEGEAARLRFLGFGVSASADAVLLVESLWVLIWGTGCEVVRERDLPSVLAAAALPEVTPSLFFRLHHEERAECTVENPPSPWNFTRSI